MWPSCLWTYGLDCIFRCFDNSLFCAPQELFSFAVSQHYAMLASISRPISQIFSLFTIQNKNKYWIVCFRFCLTIYLMFSEAIGTPWNLAVLITGNQGGAETKHQQWSSVPSSQKIYCLLVGGGRKICLQEGQSGTGSQPFGPLEMSWGIITHHLNFNWGQFLVESASQVLKAALRATRRGRISWKPANQMKPFPRCS